MTPVPYGRNPIVRAHSSGDDGGAHHHPWVVGTRAVVVAVACRSSGDDGGHSSPSVVGTRGLLLFVCCSAVWLPSFVEGGDGGSSSSLGMGVMGVDVLKVDIGVAYHVSHLVMALLAWMILLVRYDGVVQWDELTIMKFVSSEDPSANVDVGRARLEFVDWSGIRSRLSDGNCLAEGRVDC